MPSAARGGLILQHEANAPAGLFAEWLDDRGIPHETHPVWERPLPEDPAAHRWICALGSDQTPGREGAPAWVGEEIGFLRRAIDADVPVLGLCFGGQALAAAAGGEVHPADPPQVGWIEVDTADPDRIPRGPWLHFHYDQLELPGEATELARSPAGPAAFELGPHLGLQFHPETTAEIADEWAHSEEETLRRIGITAEELAEAAKLSGEGARRDARILFDAWWSGVEAGA